MANLLLNGFLQASGDGCGCASGSGDAATRRLGLRCTPAYYQSIVDTPVPLRIATSGDVGDEYADLDVLANLVAIEFLHLKTEGGRFRLRIDGRAPELTSGDLTLPTGFIGGESMGILIDGVTVTPVFEAGDQTLAQVVARINAACALAGLATPRAVAIGTTKIKITGIALGFEAAVSQSQGYLQVAALPAQIPFSTTAAFGTADYLDVQGTVLVEFPPYPDAPTRVDVSGSGTVSLMAAGRSST